MSLSEIALIVFAGSVGGAIGRRVAGGLLTLWTGYQGTQLPRLLWGAVSVMIAFAATGRPLPALLMGLGITLGSALFGYGAPWQGNTETTMRMGRSVDGTTFSWRQFAKDAAWMTYHGIGGVILPATVADLYGLHPCVLLVAGLLCAPIYALAYLVRPNIPALGVYPQDPPPFGELVWGAVVGIALAVQ